MNILLTSAGRRTYLVDYFKEALNGKGEVHVANSTWSPALDVADKSIITPLIYNNDYIDFLLDYCTLNNIKLLIPLFDVDLPILSKNKNVFTKNGIHVLVADEQVIDICNDKWKTVLFLNKIGLKTPKTYLSKEAVSEDLNKHEITFPLIVKPRWGMGSIGIYKADNEHELNLFYEKVQKEILNSYLKYESDQDINRSVLIQEFIVGQEYGLDIINDTNKSYISSFVKKKIAMRAGETDSAITVSYSGLSEMGATLANKLQHIGNLDLDCIVKDNIPFILELNCRFGGGYPFSHIAGINLPRTILDWYEGDFSNQYLSNFKIGVKAYKDIKIKEVIPNNG